MTGDTKRYTLVLPQELFDEVQEVADARHTTVVGLLRQFIKLGLMAVELEDRPDAALLIRDGESEKEIRML